LAYADEVHTVGKNIDVIKKSIEALLNTTNEVDPQAKPERTKYKLIHATRRQKNHNL
jgi:hypothetical protein